MSKAFDIKYHSGFSNVLLKIVGGSEDLTIVSQRPKSPKVCMKSLTFSKKFIFIF